MYYGINTNGEIHSIVAEENMSPKIRAFASISEWILQETVEAPNGQNCDTSQFKCVDGVISVDEDSIEERRVENLRKEYKQEMVDSFYELTVEVDGMVFQSREADLANFQLGISSGVTQWRLAENGAPVTVTTAQLQEAMELGIAQGVVINNIYNAKLEELYS